MVLVMSVAQPTLFSYLNFLIINVMYTFIKMCTKLLNFYYLVNYIDYIFSPFKINTCGTLTFPYSPSVAMAATLSFLDRNLLKVL